MTQSNPFLGSKRNCELNHWPFTFLPTAQQCHLSSLEFVSYFVFADFAVTDPIHCTLWGIFDT